MKLFPSVPKILAPLLLAIPLLAQPDEPPVKEVQNKAGTSRIERLPDGSRVVQTVDETGQVTGEHHVPPGAEGADAVVGSSGVPGIPGNGGGFFNAQIMVRPRRLAPGETGDLFVFVTLRGVAVVVPGAQMELKYDKAQGPLVLGDHTLLPAKEGTRKTSFQGKPVYDDSMQFKIPVSVDPKAKYGDVVVKAELQLTVTNGQNASPLGLFRTNAGGRIKIGPPMPKPAVQQGRQPGAPAANANASKEQSTKPAKGNASAANGKEIRSKSPDAKATGEGRLLEGKTGPIDEEGAPRVGDTAPGGGGMSSSELLYIGAGGLLLILVLLLLLRRR